MEKTAITEDLLVSTEKNGERRRQTGLVPGKEFLQHRPCLLARVWPERETHEIVVSHQVGKPSKVFVLEWAQN